MKFEAWALDDDPKEAGVGDVEVFLDDVLPRQIEAEIAIHNGDIEPREKIWSNDDPVTLFGAMGPNHSCSGARS